MGTTCCSRRDVRLGRIPDVLEGRMKNCLWRFLAPPIAVGAFLIAGALLSPLFVYHVLWGSDEEGTSP